MGVVKAVNNNIYQEGIKMAVEDSSFTIRWKNKNIFILMIFALMVYQCVCDRRANEQYTKQLNICGRQCDEKGYFKEVCTRMCQSTNCYHEVYMAQSDPIKGKLEYQISQDQFEPQFRKCWIEKWVLDQGSEQKL